MHRGAAGVGGLVRVGRRRGASRHAAGEARSPVGSARPPGDVLRCHITDCGEGEDGPVAIYIDDKEYSLREFGEILRMYAGWGMRVAFVPDDEVHEEPVIEVRRPKRGR